jgi:hypothetical protein
VQLFSVLLFSFAQPSSALLSSFAPPFCLQGQHGQKLLLRQ